MAAVTITAASIVPVAGFTRVDVLASVSLTRGQTAYLNTSNQAALAQCDGTAIEATFAGIVLNDAGAGQPVCLQAGGSLGMGAVLVAGTPYCLGRTAGQIVPFADLASTDKVTFVGWASTTSNLVLGINNTGVTLA